jgi:hypothetical protein
MPRGPTLRAMSPLWSAACYIAVFWFGFWLRGELNRRRKITRYMRDEEL